MLSDSPPERDLEWTEAGIDGAWRYLNRLWRLFDDRRAELAPSGAAPPRSLSPAATDLRRAIHQTIAAVSQAAGALPLQQGGRPDPRAVQSLEAFDPADPAAPVLLREGLETLVLLLGPMVPHLAEELWQRLGHDRLLADTALARGRSGVAGRGPGDARGPGQRQAARDHQLPRGSDRATAEAAALAEPNVRPRHRRQAAQPGDRRARQDRQSGRLSRCGAPPAGACSRSAPRRSGAATSGRCCWQGGDDQDVRTIWRRSRSAASTIGWAIWCATRCSTQLNPRGVEVPDALHPQINLRRSAPARSGSSSTTRSPASISR